MSIHINNFLDFGEQSIKSISRSCLTEKEKMNALILVAQEILDMCQCELISYKETEK